EQLHGRFGIGPAIREARELPVGVLDTALHELSNAGGMTQVENAHASARDLVLVRGPDSSTRRADLLARGALAVEQLGIREHEVSAVADVESPFDIDAVGNETVDFGEQRVRIEHDAIAPRASSARAPDA